MCRPERRKPVMDRLSNRLPEYKYAGAHTTLENRTKSYLLYAFTLIQITKFVNHYATTSDLIMPVNYAQVTAGLSITKLQSFKSGLGFTSNANAVKAYFLLQDISQYLYTPLQLVELTLRNNIHDIATSKFGNNWYSSIPQQAESIKNVAYAKQKATQEITTRPIISGDIVSRLMLGFWASMLDAPYRNNGIPNLYIWDANARNIAFQNVPTGSSIAMIANRMKDINRFRNRLFHHEPVWKSNTVNSLETAINMLKRQHSMLYETLEWMSPEKHALLHAWGFPGRFQLSCNHQRFDRNLW